MKIKPLITFATLIFSLYVPISQASLVGDRISIFGILTSIAADVADPGIEYETEQVDSSSPFDVLWNETIDVSGDAFIYTINAINTNLSSPNATMTIGSLDWTDDPLNGLITGVTQTTGPAVANITFIDNLGINSGVITIDIAPFSLAPGESLSLSFTIESSHGVVIPLAPTIIFLASGLLGLVIKRRR